MQPFIGSFDLHKTHPDPYAVFSASAARHGWHPWIVGDITGNAFHLPNTTVQGWFPDLNAASQAFDMAIAEARIALRGTLVIEKVIVMERGSAIFLSDVVKAPPLPAPRVVGILG